MIRDGVTTLHGFAWYVRNRPGVRLPGTGGHPFDGVESKYRRLRWPIGPEESGVRDAGLPLRPTAVPDGAARRPIFPIPIYCDEDRPMSDDPKRIIVTESLCNACSIDTVHVHHEHFPEMRIEGRTAEQAAGHLVQRLAAALDTVSDPMHCEAVRLAIGDTRAFLDRGGAVHIARDISGPSTREENTPCTMSAPQVTGDN
jgi:hypothetical protein